MVITEKNKYIENPKVKGSGIVCAIPQKGVCPVGCDDCFFQSGRSFLEPLEENLPNMPTEEMADCRIVRINDGNDSNNNQGFVIESSAKYKMKFYNTSIPRNLELFDAPVVLTINPGKKTDTDVNLIDPIPQNLMYVRIRVNTWNLDLVEKAVKYYTEKEIPVVFTFMAYYTSVIPEEHKKNYSYRKRTLNSYNVITPEACDEIMRKYKDNAWVYSCGKNANTFACHRCGNCIREFFHTSEKMRGGIGV